MFLLNLTQKQQTVELKGTYRSLLKEITVGPNVDLDPYAIEIVHI
ncbi:Beta-galactosidase C-terminal domain [Paenibacillus sp. NEAU-GSW1]|nr:hypothetical protein [Paenibacillus sp. NEAU-GSW1]